MACRKRQVFAMLLATGLLWGCSRSSGEDICDTKRACEEGSFCVWDKGKEGKKGKCLWGKRSEENPQLIVPDIQLAFVSDTLGPRRRTSIASPKFRMDIYGASRGMEIRFVGLDGRRQVAPCAELSTGRKKEQHQRWECEPTANTEGDYALEVEAFGAQGNAREWFAWTYDRTPPKIDKAQLEDKAEWKRDDILFVQLEGDEDIDWDKSELFAVAQGQRHRIARVACPENSLPAKPHAECFEVLLSELSDVPHGSYPLNLEARLMDEAGNLGHHTLRSLSVNVSRRLWVWLEDLWPYAGVVTREGLLVLAADDTDFEYCLLALNARGEKAWKTPLPAFVPNLLLGNHQGTDMLVASCDKGLQVFDAKTGDALPAGCNSFVEWGRSPWVLLQGGVGKDLVVARKAELETAPGTRFLQACRLKDALGNFECKSSPPVPNTNIFGGEEIVARRTPQGAEVLMGSLAHAWCAVGWTNEGGWSNDCIGGPPVSGSPEDALFEGVLGSQHLWVSLWPETTLRTFPLDGGPGVAWATPVTPLLVDTDDALIATTFGRLQRFSAEGVLRFDARNTVYNSALVGLMEGGNMLVSDENMGVVCLKPDLSACWTDDSFRRESFGKVLGVLPLSSTRSVVVFGYYDYSLSRRLIGGVLFDAPGLKKDAPWPFAGHDLCRSYNASVPIDRCWDGPR